jgi:hypothetical protein
MTFELRVVYTAPSKETVFLGAGWEPARDVRGAFISGPVGELLIERWALCGSHAFQLALTFSMATRASRRNGGACQRYVRIEPCDRAKITTNSDGHLPAFCRSDRALVRITLQPSFGPSNTIGESPETMDLVALDALEISRTAR